MEARVIRKLANEEAAFSDAKLAEAVSYFFDIPGISGALRTRNWCHLQRLLCSYAPLFNAHSHTHDDLKQEVLMELAHRLMIELTGRAP